MSSERPRLSVRENKTLERLPSEKCRRDDLSDQVLEPRTHLPILANCLEKYYICPDDIALVSEAPRAFHPPYPDLLLTFHL